MKWKTGIDLVHFLKHLSAQLQKIVAAYMTEHDRIWQLIADKLAGEANEEELQELQDLLQMHPDIAQAVQLLSRLWKPIEPDKEKLKADFIWHLERMKKQQ